MVNENIYTYLVFMQYDVCKYFNTAKAQDIYFIIYEFGLFF